MLIPWTESVKKSKTLLVYNGITNAKWMQVFSQALQSFNKLSLGIKAKQVKEEQNANVVVLTSNGTATYTFDNTEKTSTFDANKFHGYTMLFHRDGFLEKSVVFLPSEPKTMAGYSDSGELLYESPNLNQMRVIAVHELVHACGLDNDEHDNNGVFQKNLVAMGDKMGGVMAEKGSRLMPPMYLSGATKAKILKNWS